MTSFSSKTIFGILAGRFKRKLFLQLTKKSTSLFLRGKDLISYGPLVDGVHELPLTNVIKYYVKENYSDFLIDVGANIGLTSCQNGEEFRKVVCFEPNPLCVNLLKTNLAISLSKGTFIINEFALGDSEGSFELYIPKHNWGGAFVRSESNSYTDDVLASKDGFSELDFENYVAEQVEVRSAKETFSDLFSTLRDEGFRKGVIKIDVEGFESVVLEGIGKTIPSDMSVIIVFENWDDKFNFDLIKSYFSNRAIKIKKLESTIIDSKRLKFSKILALFCEPDKTHLVMMNEAICSVGDVVIEVV